MMKDNSDEIFPVVDERGNVIGQATRGECHGGSKLLHPVVHLHVFDAEGRLYLQHRPMWKDIQPGKWDTAVGGHVDFGENVEDALRREAREELGLKDFSPEHIKSYIFESEREKELVNSFKAVVNPADVHPSDELDGGRWWTAEELAGAGEELTPNLRHELGFMEKSKDFIISFDSERLGYGKVVLDNSSKGGICKGVTAVVGKNGSGKSTLGNVIEKGRYAYGNRLGFSDGVSVVKMLTFTDIHSFTGIDVQYYHQRMEATANDYVLTVGEIFDKKLGSPVWQRYTEIFRLKDIESKKINYLSSGELRKLLIINVLCESPDVLVLDNPYIGLDADSRADFDEAMRMMKESGMSVVFLLCDAGDVPDYVDSIIEMKECKIGYPITGKADISRFLKQEMEDGDDEELALPAKSTHGMYGDCDIVFSIRDGHARYGDKTIFENFNWTVRRGECWSLKGPNGSGKSLLLSMVCADNPQGYSNEITLFDRRRGTGESIWEIKDAIGYVCPEMQLYFKSNDPVKEIIVQGMRNSLNRYMKSTPEEQEVAESWMNILEIGHLSDRKFSELSSGEQRIVLLARALVKQPELMVLDEPLHGLDRDRKRRVKGIISKLAEKNGATLIFVTHYDGELPDCVRHSKKIGAE